MSDSTVEAVETTPTEGEQQEQTFKQADVDRIVAERVARERAKFSDYNDLKAKASEALTLEERLASLEGELTKSRVEALRSRVAARYGISGDSVDGKPSDVELFLTGTDEDTLTAQAERLAAREGDRKKQGNVAPKEGATKTTETDDSKTRDFAGELFGSSD